MRSFFRADFAGLVGLSCILFWFSLPIYAETVLEVAGDLGAKARTPVRREILGVNQLYYGKDCYGFLLPGTKKVDPEMVQILREIGVKSMRYPGGCGGTHTYDWQQSVGLKGGYPGLGLLEFLRVCEEIGAVPMLGISAFRGSPEEAAELVEFLNAPDDGKNPWAAQRARLGHPNPYKVQYVEYGNECYHGNHSVQPNQMITAEQYGLNYLKYREAMKKVDPNIGLGLVLGPEYWDRDVFQTVGANFDFVIVHQYQSIRKTDRLEYAQNFSSPKALQQAKDQILKLCPPERRDSLPMALTEFNTTYAEHKHLTAALANAQTLFWLCQDRNWFAAQYWQFVNEGFGMVRGKTGNFVKRPNALMFELFAQYLLDETVAVKLSGRMTPGAEEVSAELVKAEDSSNSPESSNTLPVVEADSGRLTGWRIPNSEDFQKNLFDRCHWKKGDRADRSRTDLSSDGVLSVRFLSDESYNFYHVSSWVATPKLKSVAYHLTAEIRTEGLNHTSGGALELGDGRGYSKTRSVAATESVLSEIWKPVSVDYFPLRDTQSLELKVRRFSGGGKGLIQIRNLRVSPVLYEPVVIPVVSVLTTVSQSEDKWAVLLINRSFEPEAVKIKLGDNISKIRNVQSQTLTANSPYADNETNKTGETDEGVAVAIRPLETSVSRSASVRLTLPPHSLTGVLIKTK